MSFSAANLDDLSPLVLTKLGGALEASGGGRQRRRPAGALHRRNQ